MKPNPNNFKVGDIVILDEQSEVQIIQLSEPDQLFSTIKSIENNYEWDVITRRLSPKYNKTIPILTK